MGCQVISVVVLEHLFGRANVVAVSVYIQS